MRFEPRKVKYRKYLKLVRNLEWCYAQVKAKLVEKVPNSMKN